MLPLLTACVVHNTVSEVLKLAETHSLEWPIPETLTNSDIEYTFCIH